MASSPFHNSLLDNGNFDHKSAVWLVFLDQISLFWLIDFSDNKIAPFLKNALVTVLQEAVPVWLRFIWEIPGDTSGEGFHEGA